MVVGFHPCNMPHKCAKFWPRGYFSFLSYRRAKKRLKEEKKEEEEMKEKTKHHKHNISAGFHPGIDNLKKLI